MLRGSKNMKKDEINKFAESNREAWNEVMPKHQKVTKERYDHLFRTTKNYVNQVNPELKMLNKVDVKGKNIIHLCCNNGIELLSLKNLGASNCVGVDISDEAVKEAKQRASQFNIDCEFIQSNVYEIPEKYFGKFDMVYITAGCLGWMPDIDLFFEKISSLLKKDGAVFIYEIHPFSEMIAEDGRDDSIDRLKIIEPYFKDEPYEDNDGLDYEGKEKYESKTMYWFVHAMSDIIMAMRKNEITIDFFKEYEKDISASHKKNEVLDAHIPLSYILIGKRV